MPARTYEEIDSIATRMKSAGAPDDEVRQYVTLAMQEMGGRADPVDKIPGDLNVFSFTEDIKRGKQEALRAGREDVVDELSRRQQEFAGLKVGDKFTLPSGEDVYKVDETTYASQPVKTSVEETIKREIPLGVLSGGTALLGARAAAAPFAGRVAKTVAGLIGAGAGGVGGEIGGRKILETVRPEALRELERAEAENPEAALLANVVGGGLPYQKLGSTAARTIMEDIAPRAIGAGALSGIQAGVEYLPEGDAREGALRRVLLAGGAGFALNEPTGLGNRLLGVKPMAKPPTPIKDSLGNASTKNTTTEANQAANAIAMQPPVPSVPPIDLSQINPAGAQAVDLMAQLGRAPELAGLPPGAPSAVTGAGGDDIFFAPGRQKPREMGKYETQYDVWGATEQPPTVAERAGALEGLMPRQQASETLLAKLLREGATPNEAEEIVRAQALQEQLAATRGPGKPEPVAPKDFRKQAVKYIGDQELGEGQFMPLYNLAEDIVDDAGQIRHTAGSTVSGDTLRRYGIKVPEAPKPTAEPASRPSGEVVTTSVSPEAQMPVKPKETPIPAVQEAKPAPARPAKPAAKTEAEQLADTRVYLQGEQDRYNAAARALESHPKAGEIIPLFDKANQLSEDARFLREHPADYPPARRAAATRAATKARDAAEKAYKDAGFGIKEFYDILGSYSMAKPPKLGAGKTAKPKRISTGDEVGIEAEAARQAGTRALQAGIVGNQATSAAAGGAIGYATGDDQEDRLQRAAIGAAIGAGVGGVATAAMRPGVRQAIKQGFEEAAKQRAAVPEVKPDVTRPTPIPEAGLSKQTAEWNRIIERNARLREQRRPPTGEEIYKKLTEDSAENNTSPAPKEVAEDIAQAAPNYQPLLTDLASRFPSWAKWFPGAQTISDVVGLVARGTKVAMGQVTSNLRERLPEAAGLLEDRAYRLAEITNNWTQRGLKYDELARKNLTPEEYQKFDIATQNGDVEGALAVIKGNKAEAQIRQAYDEAIAIREEVRESLIERGIEVGDVGSAFPRSVWDRKGLLKALGSDATSKYDDMVREAVKSKGSKLSEDEEIELMNQFLSRARGMAGKPGFLKGRRIEEIDAELYPFYEHGGVAMKRYLDRAAQYMLNQEFFGKARPDFAKDEGIGGSIGAALVKGLNSRKINSDDLERLSTVLRRYFRFDYQMGGEMANVANKLRNIQTFGMLADISTAAVQFADIFNIMYGYGLKGLPGYFRTGKGRIKLEDINVFEGHNVELADLSRLAQNKGPIRRAIRKAYELPLRHLLGASDAINKGGLINSAHRYWSDMVNQPNREPFKRMDEWYREMYPERWDAILADLRKPEFAKGELNDNTRFFLRNELARWQPIDLAQRAEGYAGAPAPLRLFYTLRSYAIAQQNIIRRDVYEAAKKGDYWRAIANMAFYAGAVGVGQQLFRAGMDKMLNRQIESPEEYALQGFMQLMLVPRYTIYRLKEQGPYVAAAEWLVPGANIPADITKDMMSFAKYATDQRDKKGYRTVPSLSDLGKELETTKYIPAVGREIYWMAGKGASKTEKLREQESKGKERPGSYDVIQSLFVPPDLK